MNDLDINEIVVSNMLPFGKRYFECFIGYQDKKWIRPLCIFLPKWVYIKDILIRLNVCIFW